MKLHKAYKLYQERGEDTFWASRTLKAADHMLLITSATIAKKAGCMVQEAGLKEARAGLERYPTNMPNMEPLEVVDVSEEKGEDEEEVVGLLVKGMAGSSATIKSVSTLSPFNVINAAGRKRLRDPYDEDYRNPLDDTPPTGKSPSETWIQERPAFTFRLPLRNDWGPKVTELYDAARAKKSFTHKNLDEISLLTGVLHINKTHIGLNADDIAAKWNSMKLRHELGKASGAPGLADLSMQPVLDMIMEAYNTCKDQQILPLHTIAQYVFRHLDDWGTLESESDAMASVITPILQEFMTVPGHIKFKWTPPKNIIQGC
ncbi:hypothetical protein KI688_003090 [Linnemannia hyalina]|uniref:Uncharacterized protein n=1 Tax=Linnemannia hyalina TaxID=64524 RepID=A0A9P7XP20_9FUNG|nr:hypothetical protein KI688_003090 [Linnemannia hyalina]